MKIYLTGFNKDKVTVFARVRVHDTLKLVSSVEELTELGHNGIKSMTGGCVAHCIEQAEQARNGEDILGEESS